MRIDSCKICGIKLSIKNYCKICDQPNQFFCKNCDKVNEKQVHFQCLGNFTVA